MNISFVVSICDFILKIFSTILFILSLLNDSIFFVHQIIEFLNVTFIATYMIIDICCISCFMIEIYLSYNNHPFNNQTSSSPLLVEKYFPKKVPFIRFLISIYFFFIFLKLSEDNFGLCFRYNTE